MNGCFYITFDEHFEKPILQFNSIQLCILPPSLSITLFRLYSIDKYVYSFGVFQLIVQTKIILTRVWKTLVCHSVRSPATHLSLLYFIYCWSTSYVNDLCMSVRVLCNWWLRFFSICQDKRMQALNYYSLSIIVFPKLKLWKCPKANTISNEIN